MDDTADILGGQLHVAKHTPLFSPFTLSFSGLLSTAVLILVALYGLQLLYPHYRQYQEKRYRKSMRRKHGIPDHDHRPFNVAYAAAKRAEAEEKVISRQGSVKASGVEGGAARQHMAAPTIQLTRQRQATALSEQNLRGSVAEEPSQARSGHLESRRTSGQTTTASESEYRTPGFPHDHRPVVRSASSSSMYAPAYMRSGAPGTTRSKRALDDGEMEDETQESKKTRLNSEDMMLGVDDDQAADGDIDDDMEVDERPSQSRGSKRLASLEEDEGFESSRAIGREKRPRKTFKEESLLKAMRGKKRDRAEAGSTFGGDDVVEVEDGPAQRSQPRRRIGGKKGGSVRGRKRGRETESIASDDSDSDSPVRRLAKHKRGKHSPHEEDWLSDEGMLSNDPLCKGRHIGEKWETNGVRYKVGPNGQRLRQTFVKKSQSLFPMPKDSLHPDRSANVDVYVEAWLSEEAYQIAKENNELAWQAHQGPAVDLPVVPDVPESPSKGKSLLWASTTTKEVHKQPLAKSAIVNNGIKASTSTRAIPLQPSQNGLVRRISTIFMPTPTVPDSPKLKSARSYSKWEKQDLEAAAMTRLRERVKSDASAPGAPEKKTVTFALGHTSIPPSGVIPSNSAKTADPATTSKPTDAAKPATTLSFGPSATTTTVQPAKASTSDLPSLTIPTSAPKAAEPPKPSSSSNAAEPGKIPAAAPPSTTPFSFGSAPAGKPVTKPASTNTSVPQFFAKPAPPAPASAPNVFGGVSQASASSAPQSAPASNLFGTSATATSSTPSTQAAAPTQPAKAFTGFGAPAPDASSTKPEEKPAQGASSSGPSLLSRMGGFGNPTAPSNTDAPAATASSSQPIFGFSKPAAPASTPAPAPTPASAPVAASASSGSNAPVKFNFGMGAKPGSTTTPATSTAAPSADAKPSPTFGFGTTPTPAAATGATEAPKFGFGTTSGASSGASVFGGSNGASAFGTAPKDVPATPAPKSAFAMPKTPANTTVFGMSTTPAGTPSGTIFGNAKSVPTTPANSSVFSDAMSTTPIGTPPTTSVFGNNIATTTPAGPPPAKSVFAGFGTNTGSASSAPLFGNASKPPASSSSTPIFGQPSTNTAPAAQASTSKPIFAFTAPPAASGTTSGFSGASAGASAPKPSFTFGNNGAASNSTTPTPTTAAPAQNKSIFNFGSSTTTNGTAPAFGSSAFGPAKSAAGSTAGAGQSTQPTPGMFGFGAPTGTTFAFGQKPPESGQK